MGKLRTFTAAEDGGPVTLQDIEREFGPQFEKLNEKADQFTEQLEKAREAKDTDAIDQATKAMEQLQEDVKGLTSEQNERVREAEFIRLKDEQETLKKALEDARTPDSDFLGAPASASEQSDLYGDTSFFTDAKKAIESNDPEAIERWRDSTAEKAMTQGQGTTGGYLVPPQVSAQLLQIREQENVLRPWFNAINVDSDSIRIASITQGLLAGWVAELAEKPEGEFKFGEISVNTFWKAGLAVVSNQLLRNSNPSIDNLIYNDLGKRLAALEEAAFIAGTGVGMPLGILNTNGVQSNTDVSATGLTSTDVDDLLDAIVDGITAVYSNYFGAPNAILMHPRTWGRIVKARKADATAEYFVNAPGAGPRTASDPLPGYGQRSTPRGSLFGLPVITTRHVPTNLGDADNESTVVVGNFSEGLILDHADVSLDSSEHVYFTTNQTIFRAEDAVGFTAARYPKAFYSIFGAGLAGG